MSTLHLPLRAAGIRFSDVSTGTLGLIQICEALPEDKRTEVADFARFLLEREGDERWEAIIAEGEPRAEFEVFLRDAASTEAEPFDRTRL